MNAADNKPAKAQRILMDISTLCRWRGPPVGIVRVERALARWARRNAPRVDFVFFDPRTKSFCHIAPAWLDALLDGAAYVDNWLLPDAAVTKTRFIDRIPKPLRPVVGFASRFRRQLLASLELARLRTTSTTTADRIDRIQRRFMSKKYAKMMIRPDGTRRPVLSPDLMIARKAAPQPGDVLLSVGAGWANSSIGSVEELKKQFGISCALLVHDIMPLTLPEFFCAKDIAAFKKYILKAIPIADALFFASHHTKSDVLGYCRERGISVGRTRVVPFGTEIALRRMPSTSPPPYGLRTGQYILFVSTIERRKGQGFLLGVWRDLLDAGIVKANDFHLVLIGREGLMGDEVKEQLRKMTGETGRLQVHSGVGDDVLELLYDNAAFCVYPSEYEGFGLPLIEAFQHGKAVVASDRGAIPEVVGDFSPCLPADDRQVWFDTLSRWISDPSARGLYEAAIRDRFRPVSWDEAAEVFFSDL